MNAGFQKVFAVLYEQFGDQAVAWTQQQVVNYIDARFAPGAQPSASPVSDDASDTDADAAGGAGSSVPSGGAPYDDAGYQDGDAFAEGVQASAENLSREVIISPEHVVDAVMGLVVMAGEVRKFEEAQVTKRIGIAAERDIAIARIKAQQELLQEYLDKSFDERADNFTRLFAVVDNALEARDMAALALGLESVVQLATSSPFKDLRTVEETAAALSNPDHEWDF